MTDRKPLDQPARDEALDPLQSFLVQAPAGSGKTELLTDRILALLATVKRPEEIVAITFTRKAASEMHARVMEKLSRGQDHQPINTQAHAVRSWKLARAAYERDQSLGWHLLEHPARLSIRTIDSFCASLVRGMPWLSGMGGVPSIVDDATKHYMQAVRRTIEMAGEVDCVRALLLHLDLDMQSAAEALAAMLAQRDQWMPLLEHASDEEVLQKNLSQSVTADLELVSRMMPAGWSASLAPIARVAAHALKIKSPDKNPFEALIDWDGATIPAQASHLRMWKGLASLLLVKNGSDPALRKTADARMGLAAGAAERNLFIQWLNAFNQGELPAWASKLHALKTAPDPEFSPQQLAILKAQLDCLKLAAAQLIVCFRESAEVDFIEIAQRADMALGRSDDPSELLLKLDATISHLLIDEFQDTSQTQLSLIRKLTSGWMPGDGRTLFLVGDPMQSIYRFRKAEVSLFLEVRDQGIGDIHPKLLQLTDNFRSQQGVVDWVNQVFSRMLPVSDDPAEGAISYAPSIAFNPASIRPAVQFHPVFPQSGQQAQQVAVELVRQALVRHQGKKDAVAILVRSRSHLRDTTRFLSEQGIACRAIELVRLHERSYVVDLVQMVRAVSHPGDRAAWVAFLRSPYCGLTLNALHRLLAPHQGMSVPDLLGSLMSGSLILPKELDPLDHQRLMFVVPPMLDVLRDDLARPFAAVIERLWIRLGGKSLASSPADIEDAQSVFRLVEKLAPYGGLDLDQFDLEIKKIFAAPDPSDHAVDIMTMHKSKGLQFQEVILFGLHHLSKGDKAPLVRVDTAHDRVLFGPVKPRAEKEQDPVSLYLGARGKRRAEFELDRLLYVAATRACQALHLVAECKINDENGTVEEPAKSSLLRRLWPHLPQPSAPHEVSAPHFSDVPVPAFVGAQLRRRASPLQVVHDLSAARVGSASHPFVWGATANDDRQTGILCHAWIAHIAEDGMDGWDASRVHSLQGVLRTQLSQAGVAPTRLDACVLSVSETIIAMLAHEKGRWILQQADSRREWALMDASGKVSVLDMALEHGSGWLVIDFKTGRPATDESREAFCERMRTRYQAQMQRYAQQLRAMDGRSVEAALYFPRDDIWLPIDTEQNGSATDASTE